MERKKILVAPLDWGLGHATRCIPVIRGLLDAGHEVLLAASGQTEILLRAEFPQLQFIYLPGYGLRYSSFFPAWLKVVVQLPKIFFRMRSEHRWLKKIIRLYAVDVVISDSRFGLWNRDVCSVYITHQVMIRCPGWLEIFEPLLYQLHRRVIKKYNYCWIPDYEGPVNLSGDLAHKYPLPENARFVGPLSRFLFKEAVQKTAYEICTVISGPEPSRSEFERLIMTAMKSFPGKTVVVLGKPGEERDEWSGNMRIISHLPAAELEKIIAASAFVICRSGYSGVMDLAAMKKDALLIPTPGQTEQEYIAAHLTSAKIFLSVGQSAFRFEDAATKGGISIHNFTAAGNNFSALKKAIADLMDFGQNTPG